MKNIISKILSVFMLVSSVQATDLPVFYRVPFFCGTLRKDTRDWATEGMVRYGGGDTDDGRNAHQNKKPLFSTFGSSNIINLGLGLEDVTQEKKPVTFDYWQPDNGTDKGKFIGLHIPCDSCDGKVDFKADFKARELSLGLKQNLFSGFFVEIYAPLREVRIDCIRHTICGNKTITTTQNTPVEVDLEEQFMQVDLPKILQENGFLVDENSPYDRNFKQTGFSELVLSLGWAGYDDSSFDVIDSAAGSLQAGFIVPLASKRNEDVVFAVPLGYNDHWGCFARLKGEVALWKFLVFGAQAGINILWPDQRCIRMKTAPPIFPADIPKIFDNKRENEQTGWIVLGKGKAKIDYGAVWDLAGYIKAENFMGGLSVVLGYSFTKQEDSPIHVQDCDFLKTVVDDAFNHVTPSQDPQLCCANKEPRFINKDDIVNKDKRYDGFDQHVVHGYVSYDVAYHNDCWYAPMVALEYSYHITGRHVFITNMLAGTLGLRVTWNF